MHKLITFIGIGVLLWSCKDIKQPTKKATEIQANKSYTWSESHDSIYITTGGMELQFSLKDLPLKKAMVFNANAVGYLSQLNLLSKIIGVDHPQNIYHPTLRQRIEKGIVTDLTNGDLPDYERIISRKPSVVFSTSDPSKNKLHQQLKKARIPVILVDEYKEKTPLKQAAYLKLFGRLFGKEKEANTLYKEIEANYLVWRKKAEENSPQPKVMLGVMYGDIWYMPGGKTLQAQYLSDAQMKYIFWKNTSENALQMSFEAVYKEAQKADLWLNASDYKSLNDLSVSNAHYAWFKPFKQKQIYNWRKRAHSSGANDVFETGIVRVDWVLRDLVLIAQNQSKDLYFYERLD